MVTYTHPRRNTGSPTTRSYDSILRRYGRGDHKERDRQSGTTGASGWDWVRMSGRREDFPQRSPVVGEGELQPSGHRPDTRVIDQGHDKRTTINRRLFGLLLGASARHPTTVTYRSRSRGVFHPENRGVGQSTERGWGHRGVEGEGRVVDGRTDPVSDGYNPLQVLRQDRQSVYFPTEGPGHSLPPTVGGDGSHFRSRSWCPSESERVYRHPGWVTGTSPSRPRTSQRERTETVLVRVQ